MSDRLFIKLTRELLPKLPERYPLLYLEHGRLEVDDSSIKWISADDGVLHLPVAAIAALLLGPGTSVTHEAVKVLASANCLLAWVGDDSLLYYAEGVVPTADTRNLQRQIALSADPIKRLEVARRLFSQRFPQEDLSRKTLQELMGMEGTRVRNLYEELADKYQVGWEGRRFQPGKFELGDVTNRCLTACNAALYAVVCSCLHSLGFTPRVGFIHSGSPLPFAYDVADLYKARVTIELSFELTKILGGMYNRKVVRDAFVKRMVEEKILKRIPNDVFKALGMRNRAGSSGE